ncbi:D12 class N6 adenine-specific DNA methyltransferase [Acidithrix ferrooxidans]|uniref:site-specific DNA-methyltransferase (adenine-specific) n=1 Tax=Acidithrix ferrooxidans TaxID=1280514 RepID=A0A0D8HJP7_9ACTN|nr:D12 class N6 adenine-specific DNA methyltransferase [Acidithrix ferrooxidans]
MGHTSTFSRDDLGLNYASLITYPSPLRYPGGKRKLANFIKLLIVQNQLIGCDYIEPFAGGAAVGLALLFEEYVNAIHLNDLDRSIFAFWDAVLNCTEDLCRKIYDTEVSFEEWERQRDVQLASDPTNLDLAFSTFFLNRTNRSGIITGGPIGGKDQHGQWKLDARYNKINLIQRIRKVARFRNRITLTQADAKDFLQTGSIDSAQRTLSYIDPPYYEKGRGLYKNFYEHKHHEEIAIRVTSLRSSWIVSYDAVTPIFDLYRGYQSIQYSLSYSAANRYRGNEVMFFSPELKPPISMSPTQVTKENLRIARSEIKS